jgi:2-oxo-4-hydroxy-4-carboxy-5-ureidoimidazoline decarboxylase
MPEVLTTWNELDPEDAAKAILPCCGSTAWSVGMVERRPIASLDELLTTSDTLWAALPREAWMEAFLSHPRIGQKKAQATEQSLAWSSGEQSLAMAEADAKEDLAEGNRRYETRFGSVVPLFIVCATGKSATEMLAILERRMLNDNAAEWLEAGEQQRRITQLRLRKWVGEV